MAQWKLEATDAVAGLTNITAGSTDESDDISNDAAGERNMWGDFKLSCSFGTAPVANKAIELYLLPYVNAQIPSYKTCPTYLKGVFLVEAVTSAQHLAIQGVRLPVGDFRVVLKNTTIQTMTFTSLHLAMYQTE